MTLAENEFRQVGATFDTQVEFIPEAKQSGVVIQNLQVVLPENALAAKKRTLARVSATRITHRCFKSRFAGLMGDISMMRSGLIEQPAKWTREIE